ncbi:hypothetical protein [Paenibacillus woosongensis]|uniref:Uncharacterized protein n=1 Tax=Paenibacillus woosongensis TaxID=307580 RepID=A0ABQ4MQ60_9BACL|nr:hypothetical protein [Paenibacillus woosongensis]GIP58129.1 hypothetical protein J15TS10_19430 [Paenibacillus woosongensis]
MSTLTTRLGLIKPEHSDETHQTIFDLSQNFDIIDAAAERYAPAPPTSGIHTIRDRIWNDRPAAGSYAGWICTRTGRAAPAWTGLTSYSIGQTIVPTAENGHYYECIQAGYSAVQEPTFPVTSGTEVEDTKAATTWTANKAYAQNEIVFPTIDNGRFYVCTVAGDSGMFEPVWATSNGYITNDGTVAWSSYRIAKWREAGVSTMFRPFGKIE